MKVTLVTADDKPPKPMDVVVAVTSTGGAIIAQTEPSRIFYARHLIASERMLLGWVWRLALTDLKRIWHGEPKRPIETVADAIDRTVREPSPLG